MIENPTDFLPIWMLLSAAFGFMIGDAFGDSTRHRKCLEQTNEDLRDQLDEARTDDELLHKEMKRQRGELNDIHKHVVAVSKALEKHPS